MTVDKGVIRSLLVRLDDHIGRVEEKRPAPIGLLLTDRDLQDILSHNLEKAVQVCVDIASHVCAAHGKAPETAGDSFRALADLGLMDEALAGKLVSAVGFRNVSVHQYADVDWAIVTEIAVDGLRNLKEFGRWAASLAVEVPPGSDLKP